MRVHTSLAAAILVAIVSASGTLRAQPGDSESQVDLFVTFGDSLSDTGNLYVMTKALRQVPAIPPSDSPYRTYFDGRFSNGRVGFERLWDRLRGDAAPLRALLDLRYMPSKGAVDFSFGGSTSGRLSQTPGGLYVPGLLGQVDLFLTLTLGKGPLPARTMAAIVTGSNDYLKTPPAKPANPEHVVDNIVAAIKRLHNRGVGTVMVVNVFDLGAVPLVASADVTQRAALTALSHAHNTLLAGALATLAAQRPSLRIIPIDVADVIATLPPIDTTTPAVIAALITAGATVDAAQAAAACLFVNPTTCVDVPTFAFEVNEVNSDFSSNFFFWDVVHPTATVHQALGDYMCTLVDGCQVTQ